MINILSLGKCVRLVIKEKGFLGEHDEIPGQLIPSIFNEGNVSLDADNMLILKRHDMKCYSQMRKKILDHMEDIMIQDFLVGSAVCHLLVLSQ
jgi:hypothetical protein